MTPAALVRIFDKFKDRSGIVGVAFGPKEVAGKTKYNPLAVTFFVRRKLPVRGARTYLAGGRARLPKLVEFQGSDVPTDVVTTDAVRIDEGKNRSPPQIFRAGGKVSNRQVTGTLGCLVKRRGSSGFFAVTNRHIGLDPGTVMAFPDFQSSDVVAGTTAASVSLVPDETFLPLFDAPDSYIDVDCALIGIPPGVQDRFSPDIPNFGPPADTFMPKTTDQAEYTKSLIGRDVFSYSWKSGQRSGQISHVFYVYQRSAQGMQRVACFTVKSSDSGPPGLLGDSGKLWMTRENGKNLAIGLHMGVVAEDAASSRFAMVTEFAALSRFMNISVV